MPGDGTDTTIALVSLADAKAYLKITSSTDDTVLISLINFVSGAVNSYCGRYLLSKEHTEYYSGDGGPDLILRNFPVASVSHLFNDVDRDFVEGSEEEIDVAEDVIIQKESGILTLWNNESSFSTGMGNIKVVYTAGYALASVPYDIQQAVKMWVAREYMRHDKRRHDIQSESIGDMTVTFQAEDIPGAVKKLLEPHRTHGYALGFLTT